MKKKAFYSTTEVADICNVHRNTIILAIKKGDLKSSSTPGGHNRVAHKDLLRFIRERDLPVIAVPGEDEEQGAKILVVDDDPAFVRFVEQTLKKEGYTLKVATNGYDAGVATASFAPDLILLDYLLPDVKGDQVLRALREREETQDTRVLVITALEDVEAESQFGEDVPVMRKPFSAAELRSRVGDLLATQPV